MPNLPVPAPFRRTDLDWLRVSAFGLLILYHAGMAWSGWSWHLTSTDSIDWLREGMRFVNRWRMPLIFVVSGAAIMLALGTRSPGAFALDRVRRLLLPLAFGMAVVVPPQVYLERLYSGQFSGSFLEWLPQAFVGVYPAGNMSWHHLWFLAYVLVLTFVLLPCLLWARSTQGRAAHARAGHLIARTGLQWLMPLPLAAAMSLAIGIAAYALFYVVFVDGAVRPVIRPEDRPAYALLSAVNTMAWLFAILGFANRYLTRRPAFLAEASEAVYPFYMLHQTVTVIAVYWLLEIGVPPVAGFILAALATFLGTTAIYICVVRPLWFIRPLFGLKATYSSSVRPSARLISRSRRMPNFSSER